MSVKRVQTLVADDRPVSRTVDDKYISNRPWCLLKEITNIDASFPRRFKWNPARQRGGTSLT